LQELHGGIVGGHSSSNITVKKILNDGYWWLMMNQDVHVYCRTLQSVLAILSDLVTNEHVQTKEPKPLPIELEDLQHVEFELVNNHLTHGSIKGNDVHVHYYHDVHV